MIHSFYLNFTVQFWNIIGSRVAKITINIACFCKSIYFLQYCIKIGKTNKRYADPANLPVTIWIYFCGVMMITFLPIVSWGNKTALGFVPFEMKKHVLIIIFI